MGERDLPRHVQLVWHGVNDDANLRQFLASPVRWAEMDIRRHPRGRLVIRHDAFDMGEPAANGWGATGAGDGLLSLDEALAELRDAGKGVKIDAKEAGILDEVLAVVARSGVTDEDLWLNGRLGRPAVLVAVSGTSAAFDARGRRLAWVDQDETGAWTVEVPLSREETLFVRWGDWVPASCAVVVLAAVVTAVRPAPALRLRRAESVTRRQGP